MGATLTPTRPPMSYELTVFLRGLKLQIEACPKYSNSLCASIRFLMVWEPEVLGSLFKDFEEERLIKDIVF